MFYVLIFSLAAVLLVVAGLTTMSRRRRGLRAEESHAVHGEGHATHADHGTHPDAAARRNRKAKRRANHGTTGASVTEPTAARRGGSGVLSSPLPLHDLSWWLTAATRDRRRSDRRRRRS